MALGWQEWPVQSIKRILCRNKERKHTEDIVVSWERAPWPADFESTIRKIIVSPFLFQHVRPRRSFWQRSTNGWRPFSAKGYRCQDDFWSANSHLLSIRHRSFFSTIELLPDDVVCAKETRDLVIECCVGEHESTFIAIALNTDWIHCRIHPLNILGGKWNMRAGE